MHWKISSELNSGNNLKLLATIRDADIEYPEINTEPTSKRTAARAIVTDPKGAVAMLFVRNHGYYKLPGGGVESGEDIEIALARELLEEIGCEAKITNEVGIINEYCGVYGLFQTSHCFVAVKVGDTVPPQFTDDEKANGFEIMWLGSIDEAIEQVQLDKPDNYEGKFIQKRDLIFLKTAKALNGPRL